jgi:hypothetical protein
MKENVRLNDFSTEQVSVAELNWYAKHLASGVHITYAIQGVNSYLFT